MQSIDRELAVEWNHFVWVSFSFFRSWTLFIRFIAMYCLINAIFAFIRVIGLRFKAIQQKKVLSVIGYVFSLLIFLSVDIFFVSFRFDCITKA